MTIQRNQVGIDYAKEMIEKNQYVKDSDWSQAQPSRDDENDFLERHGWDDYAKWHLAIDTDENEETKARYKFPYGDFRRVHRSGAIAAKQRAGEWDYSEVLAAADELLDRLPDPN